jgi:dienelactone hydrolase
MAIIAKTLDYYHQDTRLQAYVAYEESDLTPKPVVLINPTWAGRDQFVMEKAEKIAGLGYVGFAVDMYGDAKVGSGKAENAELMQPFMNDRTLLQERMQAALATARALPEVDSAKCAAIGFCFGGLCVLDLARTGADLAGVASFHGLLAAPGNTDGNKITAKILALHGHDDPMGPPEQVLAFQQEMTKARADWQMHVYGHTLHAFTNPVANDKDFGTVYQPAADRRSWQSLQNFLTEVFG